MNEALDAMFEPAVQVVPEPVVEPAPELQPEVVETPEPVVLAPQPEVQPQPVQQEHHVPLPKYLDERERRKDLERRIAAYEAEKPSTQRPDPLDDPDGYDAHINQQIETRLSEQRFQMSDLMARQMHGAETVEAAVEWAQGKAQADPMFAASYMRDPNPIDWIVRQHKRDALLSDIGDNVDDWFTREAAKRGYAAQSAPAAVVPAQVVPAAIQAPKPAVPPRSLVAAPSAGGIAHVPTGLNAGMEAVFPK